MRWVAALLLLLFVPPALGQQSNAYKFMSSAAEASHIFCTSACRITGFQVNTGAASGWVMVFDGPTVPADGAVAACSSTFAPPCLVKAYQVPANSTVGIAWDSGALTLVTGFVLVCSTTGPYTKTATATCEFGADGP